MSNSALRDATAHSQTVFRSRLHPVGKKAQRPGTAVVQSWVAEIKKLDIPEQADPPNP